MKNELYNIRKSLELSASEMGGLLGISKCTVYSVESKDVLNRLYLSAYRSLIQQITVSECIVVCEWCGKYFRKNITDVKGSFHNFCDIKCSGYWSVGKDQNGNPSKVKKGLLFRVGKGLTGFQGTRYQVVSKKDKRLPVSQPVEYHTKKLAEKPFNSLRNETGKGNELARIRIQAALSKTKMAKLLGVVIKTVRNIEDENTKPKSIYVFAYKYILNNIKKEAI